MVASRRKKRRRVLLLLVPLILLLGLGTAIGMDTLGAVAVRMAEARVRAMAVDALERAVDRVMGAGIAYDDLVKAHFDEGGRLAMLESNTMRMNDLSSKVALSGQENLNAASEAGVSIPLWAALGVSVLSSSGPMIHVRVIPVGSVTTSFVTSFESAGINQTRHEITLIARVSMRIVVPTGAQTVSVETSVPIAESIIVGQVPDSFVQVPEPETAIDLMP